MIDSYIILNRKPSIILKVYLFNIILIIIIVIWGINTFYYQNYFQIHSEISNFNSFYFLEVLIPVKEVNQITKQNKIIIDKKEYYYQVYKINPDIIYKNNINYQKIYLEVNALEDFYQKKGYHVVAKIPKERKRIIDYLKE